MFAGRNASDEFQRLKNSKSKDVKTFPLFFRELRHRICLLKSSMKCFRQKKLSMFAFENIVKQQLAMELDVRVIRGAFRSVEDVSACSLSFDKFVLALVGSSLDVLGSLMKVLKENFRAIMRIKEEFVASFFLANEWNRRRASGRVLNKLDFEFLEELILLVKLKNIAKINKAGFVSLCFSLRKFLKIETEIFFGSIFDLVRKKTVFSSNFEEKDDEVSLISLITLTVLISTLKDKEKMLHIFSVLDRDDDGCLSHEELIVFFFNLCKWNRHIEERQFEQDEDDELSNLSDLLARQQTDRIVEMIMSGMKNSDDSQTLVNFEEVMVNIPGNKEFFSTFIPGIICCRWLLPKIPPFEDSWRQVIVARESRWLMSSKRKRVNFLRKLKREGYQLHSVVFSLIKQGLLNPHENWKVLIDEDENENVEEEEIEDVDWTVAEEWVRKKLGNSSKIISPASEHLDNLEMLSRPNTSSELRHLSTPSTTCSVRNRPLTRDMVNSKFGREMQRKILTAFFSDQKQQQLPESAQTSKDDECLSEDSSCSSDSPRFEDKTPNLASSSFTGPLACKDPLAGLETLKFSRSVSQRNKYAVHLLMSSNFRVPQQSSDIPVPCLICKESHKIAFYHG